MIISRTSLVAALLLFFLPACSRAQAAFTVVSIVAYGAVGDGKTDNTQAFEKAWRSGAKTVRVPAGTFAVSKITVPEGTTLEGDGSSSVVVPVAAPSNPLITLDSGATVRHLTLDGRGASVTCLRTGASKNVTVQDLAIANFKGMAIETDHAEDMVIAGCTISHVQRAANLQFSRRVHVLNNTVTDCTEHGFQFWGNWKWQSKESSDLFFLGNYVRDGGNTGIWGSGAERVVIANNIVDGAEDVGLDLEWCDDSVISGNSVCRVRNGGIALFFACQGVAITGNTIRNDRPISAADAKAAWWARSGIWLTYPNRKEFPQDFGHRDVTITGNVIDCAAGERRAVWIGAESDNIALRGNVLRGGKVWQGGGDQPMTVTATETTIHTAHLGSRGAK